MLRRALYTTPVVVATPVLLASLPKVHASEEEGKKTAEELSETVKEDPIKKQLQELRAKQTDKRIPIRQLPLYGEPEAVGLVYIPEKEDDSFRSQVSVCRKAVWKQLDNFEGTWNAVKKNYQTTKKYAQDLAVYLQEDAGALPRAAFITVSGLGGVVAGYRGGVIRKTLFAGLGMTGAASVCYAEQAVDISRQGWILTKDQAQELWKQVRSGSTRTDQAKEISSPADVKNSAAEKSEEKSQDATAATSSKVKDTVKVAGKDELELKSEPAKDFGQSKEEDKNMYSTRTS